MVIKLLHAQHAGQEQVADRLRLEAQAVAALAPRTPHVVQILDFGHTGAGRAYIVMEHLEGRTLGDELAAHGLLPPVEAVDIAVQILDGLAAAHDAGIIHRDVKPDNVFLCPSPSGGRTVKLLDFGLAKLARDLSGEGGPAPLVKPTEEGTILGSPLYFSPEQASGNPATPRSDLYSTGVVLYHMLAGRPPFGAGDNLYVLVTAHLATPPPPLSAVAPQPIPEALDRAVQKALAKRPEDRHESAGAFRAALERALVSAPRVGADRADGPRRAGAPRRGATALGGGAVARASPATEPPRSARRDRVLREPAGGGRRRVRGPVEARAASVRRRRDTAGRGARSCPRTPAVASRRVAAGRSARARHRGAGALRDRNTARALGRRASCAPRRPASARRSGTPPAGSAPARSTARAHGGPPSRVRQRELIARSWRSPCPNRRDKNRCEP